MLVVAGLVLAFDHAAYAQDEPVRLSDSAARAQVPYERGVVLYDQDHFEEAMAKFRESLAAYPSPNPGLYIARCLRELNRPLEALTEYEQTVQLATERARTEARYARTRDAAVEELREIQTHVGHVRLDPTHIPADAHVRLGEREIERAALDRPIAVMPGTLAVRVEAPGFQPASSDVEVAAGIEVRLDPQLVSDRATGGGLRTASYIALGAGVVGFIGAGIFGIAANNQYQRLLTQCSAGPCPESLRGEVNTGRTLDTVTNVALAVGVVGVLAGVAMFVVSSRRPGSRLVRLGFNGSSLLLSGEF